MLWSGAAPAGPGWLGASGAGAHGGPRRRRRVVGAPMVLTDQRTPVAAGPAPCVGCARSCCAISGGTRRSPHHRCPQAGTGYIDCQRAPNSSVHSGTVMRHSQLVGPRGPSHLHGHYGSERALGTRLEEALRARGSRTVEAARSTLGSTSLRTHAAACRRFPRQRASSNGWPVCMIIRSSGTSFRAMVQTALVPGTPRARIASYSGR